MNKMIRLTAMGLVAAGVLLASGCATKVTRMD
ncbi:MAG: hypothetical protein RL217_886, partial [Pseudomonadota bacterium]